MKREDPNKGISESVRKRLEEASRERFYAQLLQSIQTLLDESGRDWDWLYEQVAIQVTANYCQQTCGLSLKEQLGMGLLSPRELVIIGQCFGLEPYLLFRPRTLRANGKGETT